MIFNVETLNVCKECGVRIAQYHPHSLDKACICGVKNLRCSICCGETYLVRVKGLMKSGHSLQAFLEDKYG